MTISNDTRIIDLTVGQLENIFQKFSTQNSPQISTSVKPMTTEQLSEFLGGMPLPTIYYKVSKGVIPHIKEGGKLYFLQEQIMDWLKTNQRYSTEQITETAFQDFRLKLKAKI
jgi:excisionase family DNA binding protein